MCSCSYEFGIVDNTNVSHSLYSGSSSSYTYSSLPQGNNTLYVCITNALGAKTCETSTAAVDPPPANFKPTDALSKLDVDKVASTSDVSVAADIAASISNYNAISNSNSQQAASTSSSSSRGLLGTITGSAGISSSGGTAGSQQDMFKQAIQAKSTAMVMAMAKTVDAYVTDVQSVGTVSIMFSLPSYHAWTHAAAANPWNNHTRIDEAAFRQAR